MSQTNVPRQSIISSLFRMFQGISILFMVVAVALAAAAVVVVVVFAKSSLASQALLFFSEDKIFYKFCKNWILRWISFHGN